MSAPGSHNKARIIAVMGATGTGKGRYIKTELIPMFEDRRILIWSALEKTDNYASVLKCKAVESLVDMIAQWRAGKSCVFVPPKIVTKEDAKRYAEAFSLWCRAVAEMNRCFAFVEELSRVTSPGYAPQAWSDLSTACRHEDIVLGASAQRPAQVDKDFLGNATEVRGFRVGYENDAKALACVLRVPWESMLELPDFHYAHRYKKEARTIHGVLGEKPQKAAPIAKKVAARKPVKSRKKQ